MLQLTIVLKRTMVIVVVMTVASSELLVRPPSVNCRKKRSNISFMHSRRPPTDLRAHILFDHYMKSMA
jgi:hypothetical protein